MLFWALVMVNMLATLRVGWEFFFFRFVAMQQSAGGTGRRFHFLMPSRSAAPQVEDLQ